MILTYKTKHNRNFSAELKKAHRIAEFALRTRAQSSKDVACFGLKSLISNQILREYSRNKKLKRVGRVNLIIPNQGITERKEEHKIWIPSLKLQLRYRFPNNFKKINQIEVDEEYAYISVYAEEQKPIIANNYIGVDRNTTGHIAVAANPDTGKVLKLGKEVLHIHNKYKNIRKRLQKKGKFGLLKKIKHRESNRITDINHKVADKIVDYARENNSGIKLEKLEGIRNSKKHIKRFNYSLHSWSFKELQSFIEYKAKLCGIPVAYVEPQDTSQECSRCGNIGTRIEKKFVCQCGHVDHADVNASFNIALRPPIGESIGRLHADRDVCKGSTDTPKEATLRTTEASSLQTEYAQAERNLLSFR